MIGRDGLVFILLGLIAMSAAAAGNNHLDALLRNKDGAPAEKRIVRFIGWLVAETATISALGFIYLLYIK